MVDGETKEKRAICGCGATEYLEGSQATYCSEGHTNDNQDAPPEVWPMPYGETILDEQHYSYWANVMEDDRKNWSLSREGYERLLRAVAERDQDNNVKFGFLTALCMMNCLGIIVIGVILWFKS